MTKNRIFFEPKDLLKIPDFADLSKTSMYRKYNEMKGDFDKRPKQKLTFSEVAQALGIPEELLRKTVQSFHKIPV